MIPALEYERNNYRITGDVSLQSLDDISKALLVHAAKNETMYLDLNQISACDSAFVALLMACLRIKKQQRQSISISGCPEKVLDMVEVYGVDKVLRITN